MKRRITAFFLALLLIVSMAFVDMPTAKASDVQSGLTSSAQEVHPGDTFEIQVVYPKIAEEKVCSLEGKISFKDAMTAFEIIEIKADAIEGVATEVTTPARANQNGNFNITWYDDAPVAIPDGYTVTATVKVKENAKGIYSFVMDSKVPVMAYDGDGVELYEANDCTSVSINVTIPATNVTVDAAEITLKEGETQELTTKLTPATTSDEAVWTSSNEEVVTVTKTGDLEAVVTAVKKGEATITVTAGSVSAECKVTVECAHKNTTTHEKVDPSCTEVGHEAYEKCDDCGVVVSGEDKEIEMVAHTLTENKDDEYLVTAATCEGKGVYNKSCSVCGFESEETFEVPALGHKFTKEVEQVEPTCTTEGQLAHFECTACDKVSVDGTNVYSESLVMDKLGHDLEHFARVEAECEKAGNIEYWRCKREDCKKYFDKEAATEEDEIVEKETIISPKQHENSGNWYTEDATHHWKPCGNCGNEYVYEKGEHVFVVKNDATYHWEECTTCARKQNTKEHTYTDVVAEEYLVTPATCTTGNIYKKSCECGLASTETFEDKDSALGHAYQHVEEDAPDCENAGTAEHYTCSRCSQLFDADQKECEADDLVLNKLGHKLEEIKKVDPTCTTPGNEAYWKCTNEGCGKYFSDKDATKETTVEENVIPARGHKEAEEWTTDGENHWKVCDYEDCLEVLTDKVNHEFAQQKDATHHWDQCEVCKYVANKEAHKGGSATCLEKAECTECGEKYDYIGAHNYVEVVADKYLKQEAACEANAVYYKSCSVCENAHASETFEKANSALGHAYKEVEKVEPTCETTGKEAHFTCTRCPKFFTTEKVECEETSLVIKALGHELEEIAKVAPTCTTPGNEAYWKCTNGCGKYFSDKEATKETSVEENELPKLGHEAKDTWETTAEQHWKVCKRDGCSEVLTDKENHDFEMKTSETQHWEVCKTCGYETTKEDHKGGTATCTKKAECEECYVEYGDLLPHSYGEVVDAKYLVSEAECEANAVYKKSCTACELAHTSETFEKANSALGHDYKEVAEVDSTCDTEGKKAHYTCTRCPKLFTTEKVECEEASLVITKLGHDAKHKARVEATCTEDGNKEYWYCDRTGCGEYFSDAEATTKITLASTVLTKLDHEAEAEWTKDAENHWKECVRCGAANITDKDTHDFEVKTSETQHWEACKICGYETAKEDHKGGTATCIKKAECDDCKAEYGNFAAHDYVEVKEDKYVQTPASCEGKGTYYKSCSVCGIAHASETFEVPALGHDYKAVEKVEAACETAGTEAHHTCTRCDKVFDADKVECQKADLVIPATGHTYEEVVDAKYLVSEATCIAKAVYKKSCTVCEKAHAAETFETGEVDADNHTGGTELKDAKETKCFEAGYTGDTYCKSCDEMVEKGEEIAKLPHNITTWTVTKEPTTTETGVKTGYCENKEAGCTEEHTVTIAKLVETGSEVKVEAKDETDEIVVESVIISSESNVNENVILQVEEVSDELSGAEKAEIEEAAQKLTGVEADSEVVTILDISMILRETTDAGDLIEETEFELDGSVEIKLQLPEELVKNYENLVLIHVKDDGSVEVIPYTIDANNVVTFTANGFSYYTFVGTEKEEVQDNQGGQGSGEPGGSGNSGTQKPGSTSPITGDGAKLVLWFALAILAIGTVVVTMMKKRQK